MNDSQNYGVLPMFASPLFGSRVFVSPEEIEYIKNLEYERTVLDNGLVTKEPNILYHDALSNLRQNIENEFETFRKEVLEINHEFFICASWAVKHRKGDFSQAHMHKNSFFSGILYLIVDKNSGDLVFEKVTSEMFELNYDKWNLYNTSSMIVKPAKYQLLLFPSTVRHSVTRSNSDIERLALSFNFFIKDYTETENVTSQLILKLE